MKQKLIALLLLGQVFMAVYGQTMNVKDNNTASISSYPVSSIKKLTFSSGNLVVSRIAAADATQALKDLRYVNFNDLALAVGENTKDAEAIFIYPNPVADVLRLAAPAQSIRSIAVISMDGRVLLQTKPTDSNVAVDVSKLAKAYYLCSINTATATKTIKFLKQ